MSNPDWSGKYNIVPVTTVTDIDWDGVKLSLPNVHTQMLAALLRGDVPTSAFGRKPTSNCVIVSQLRGMLEEIGFPLGIKNIQGKRDGYYTLVELPQKPGDSWWEKAEIGGEDECNHSARPSADSL